MGDFCSKWIPEVRIQGLAASANVFRKRLKSLQVVSKGFGLLLLREGLQIVTRLFFKT